MSKKTNDNENNGDFEPVEISEVIDDNDNETQQETGVVYSAELPTENQLSAKKGKKSKEPKTIKPVYNEATALECPARVNPKHWKLFIKCRIAE